MKCECCGKRKRLFSARRYTSRFQLLCGSCLLDIIFKSASKDDIYTITDDEGVHAR